MSESQNMLALFIVDLIIQHITSGMETASHAGHCPINLVNVW